MTTAARVKHPLQGLVDAAARRRGTAHEGNASPTTVTFDEDVVRVSAGRAPQEDAFRTAMRQLASAPGFRATDTGIFVPSGADCC